MLAGGAKRRRGWRCRCKRGRLCAWRSVAQAGCKEAELSSYPPFLWSPILFLFSGLPAALYTQLLHLQAYCFLVCSIRLSHQLHTWVDCGDAVLALCFRWDTLILKIGGSPYINMCGQSPQRSWDITTTLLPTSIPRRESYTPKN